MTLTVVLLRPADRAASHADLLISAKSEELLNFVSQPAVMIRTLIASQSRRKVPGGRWGRASRNLGGPIEFRKSEDSTCIYLARAAWPSYMYIVATKTVRTETG